MGIEDETLALDFNLACSFRLLVFDNEREADKFKKLSTMLGGSDEESGGSIQDDDDTQFD